MQRKAKENRRNKWYFLSAAMASLWVFANCAPMGEEPAGKASISVTSQALSAADTDAIEVTITGQDIAAPIKQQLTRAGSNWTGTIANIPSGKDRIFSAEARDKQGQLLFKGAASGVEILAGKTALVLLKLQQQEPPKAFSNAPPELSSLVAIPGTVTTGGTVNLNVVASDPNPSDNITYTWTADAGSFAKSDTAQTTWSAPTTPGTYRLNIKVSDKHGLHITVSTSIIVASNNGSANIQASFNFWPQITNILASPARIDKGELTQLTPVALDPDGDTLKYEWKDEGGECAGLFSNHQAKTTSWTAPIQQPKAKGCNVSVVVTDGKGGRNVGKVWVQIGEKHKFRKVQDHTPPTTTANVPNGYVLTGIGEVELTCQDSNSGCADIIYTTDGTEPSFSKNNGTIIKGDKGKPNVFVFVPFETIILKFAGRDKAGNIESTKTLELMTFL